MTTDIWRVFCVTPSPALANMAVGEAGSLPANFTSWRCRVLRTAIFVVALSLVLEMSRFVQEEYFDFEDNDEEARGQQRRRLPIAEEGEQLGEILPGSDPVLEGYWDTFEELRAAFHSVSRLLTLVLLCVAKLRHGPRKESRVLLRAAFGCALMGPYLFAAVPWYETLGFADLIEGKRGPGMLSVDAGFYRIKLSAQLYGLTSSVLLAVLPAMIKACVVWKMLTPSLTLWGDALTVLPLLYFAVSFSALAVAVQSLGYYEIALYNLFYSGTYLVYPPAAAGINANVDAHSLLVRVAWRRVLILMLAYSCLATLVLRICVRAEV